MTLITEEYKTDEFRAFVKDLIRNDIREMVRSEVVSLSRELPKTTLEAVVLQQLLDNVKKQGDAITGLKEELRDTREEMDRRFEQVDHRFEQVDRRFEQVDRRFEQVDHRFEQVDHRFDAMDQNFADLKSWVGTVVGGFQNRAGANLEEMVAGTLRLALNRKDIRSDSIKLRKKFVDADGVIGLKGRRYETDVLAEGDSLLVFEVKSLCDLEMAERFADKVELVRHLHPDKEVDGALIALEPRQKVLDYCAKKQIAVVS